MNCLIFILILLILFLIFKIKNNEMFYTETNTIPDYDSSDELHFVIVPAKDTNNQIIQGTKYYHGHEH